MYEEELKAIGEKFNELKAQQNQLIADAQKVEQELLRLQGEHRAIERLDKETQAETGTQIKGKELED